MSIADEVPFDIPDLWEWVRLGNLIQLQSGQDLTPDRYNSNGDGIPYITGASNIEDGNVIINRWTEDGRAFAYYGDILLTCKGTVGTIAVLREPVAHIARQIMGVRPYEAICKEYVILTLESLVAQLKAAAKSMIPGIARENVLTALIPLPPRSEQERIVAKYQQILPIIQSYDSCFCELSSLNEAFPDQLRKSILQMAVQGKLVPQDPSDEPASILLERICAEKERLIKEGKIKRDKNESVIFRRDNSHYEKLGSVERCIDEEIQCDLPESWIWCRMSSLFSINPRSQLSDDTVVGFMPMPLLEDGFRNNHTFEERRWGDVKNGFTHFKNGDVVIAKITPCFQNRKSAVIVGLPNDYGAGTTELHVLRDDTHILYMPYFLLCCKTHDFITGGVANFTGTAGQQRVGKDYISNYLVPLPPVSEQVRIVDAVKSVFTSLDELL